MNNINDNKNLISNERVYFYDKKYISIKSSDRNILKYPNANQFEIELPEDYTNVHSIRLISWYFPSKFESFTKILNNILLIFKFEECYNPAEHGVSDPLSEAIFAGLYYNIENSYSIYIEAGSYDYSQMVTELKTKLNEVVTLYLKDFFTKNTLYNYALPLFTTYERFEINYHQVSERLWFGNTADKFTIIVQDGKYLTPNDYKESCSYNNNINPGSYAKVGLPNNLGFNNCNITALSCDEINKLYREQYYSVNKNVYIQQTGKIPRFYYTSVNNGYWLQPNPVYIGSKVYFFQCPIQLYLSTFDYIIMELDEYNCIDETRSFQINKESITTNNTISSVNASFAKIPITGSGSGQFFDSTNNTFRFFNPPLERVRKLKMKFRFEDNVLVDFGNFDFTLLLEVTKLTPQNIGNITLYDSFTRAKYS